MKKNIAALGACAVLSLAALTQGAQAEEAKAKAGVYVSIGAGMNWIDDLSESGTTAKLDSGYTIQGAIGYDTGDITSFAKFRVEGEISYTENDYDSVSGGGLTLQAGGQLEQLSYMVNGYVDFLPGSSFRPYLGVGLGYMDGDETITIGGASASSSGTEFAYRGLAGAAYHFDENWALDVGYRYTTWEANAEANNHALVAGLRYMF